MNNMQKRKNQNKPFVVYEEIRNMQQTSYITLENNLNFNAKGAQNGKTIPNTGSKIHKKNFKQNSIRQRYIIFNIGEPPSCQSFIQFSFEFTQLYMLANGQANLI